MAVYFVGATMQLKIRIIFLVISLLAFCDAESEKQQQRKFIGESSQRTCQGPVGVARRYGLTNLTESDKDLLNNTALKIKCRKYTKRRYQKLQNESNRPTNPSGPSIAIATQYKTLVINTDNSSNNIEFVKVLQEFFKDAIKLSKPNTPDVNSTLKLNNKNASSLNLGQITALAVFRIDNANSKLHEIDMKRGNETIGGAFPNSKTTRTSDLNKNDTELQIIRLLFSTTEAAFKNNDNISKLRSTTSDFKDIVSLHRLFSTTEAAFKNNYNISKLRSTTSDFKDNVSLHRLFSTTEAAFKNNYNISKLRSTTSDFKDIVSLHRLFSTTEAAFKNNYNISKLRSTTSDFKDIVSLHRLFSTTEAAFKNNYNISKLRSTTSDLKDNVSLHRSSEAPLKYEYTTISLHRTTVKTEFEELQSKGFDLIERTTFGMQNPKKYDQSTATNCVEVPTVHGRSGIYTLRSKVRNYEPFKVYCNMKFRGGGWTVIQRRIDGSIDFDRDWHTYKNGFGQLLGEFWLGLEKIYQLTALTPHELVITMKDYNGKRRFARYDIFKIGDEMQDYELYSLKRYNGNGRDSLIHNLGNKFSTSSVQIRRPNCVKQDYGGWWYGKCSQNNLNSVYDSKSKASLKFVEMMIRPLEYKFRG